MKLKVTLAKFAKLIREILQNSRVDSIPLEKEVEVLELYLSLEQLRFSNRFSYRIEMDDNIDEEFVTVPPMLIQPFVENAIIHGFEGLENGVLTIRIHEEDDQIVMEVDDNGIGRQASAENQPEKKHESLATTITQERLDALSQDEEKAASFEIIDKIDPEDQKSLGTKVVIRIPSGV